MHAATLSAHPDVRELVVGDLDGDLAAALAAKLGCRNGGGPAETLRAGLDAVVIAASTSAHGELITEAAGLGLPTFCEKPITLDIASSERVLETIRAAGIPLQIGFQRRFDPGYLAAREALRSGELGTLLTVRLISADPVPPPASFIPASGGLFHDLHIHDFDAVRFVTGREVASVYAMGANLGDPYIAECGDVDTSAALLLLRDGTPCTVSGSRLNGAGYDVRMEVAGTRDTAVAGLDDNAPLRPADPGVRHPPGRWPSFLERFASAYAAELHAFLEVAAGMRAPRCTGEDALAASRIAEAAERSRITGRPAAVRT